jgi:hypothetical protein
MLVPIHFLDPTIISISPLAICFLIRPSLNATWFRFALLPLPIYLVIRRPNHHSMNDEPWWQTRTKNTNPAESTHDVAGFAASDGKLQGVAVKLLGDETLTTCCIIRPVLYSTRGTGKYCMYSTVRGYLTCCFSSPTPGGGSGKAKGKREKPPLGERPYVQVQMVSPMTSTPSGPSPSCIIASSPSVWYFYGKRRTSVPGLDTIRVHPTSDPVRSQASPVEYQVQHGSVRYSTVQYSTERLIKCAYEYRIECRSCFW